MSEENKTKKLLEMREEEPKKTIWTSELKKNIREWIVSIVAALVIFVLLRTFLFTMIRVDGESMLETLQDGDRLFVTVLDVRLGGVENEDVVICNYPDTNDGMYRVKRVIGMPGETIQLLGGELYVDGVHMEQDFDMHSVTENFGPFTVPEDHYFVLGDNRNNSRDSRFTSIGMVDERLILGRAWWQIFPLNKLGFIG